MSNTKYSSVLDGRIDNFASNLLLFQRIETALKSRLQRYPNDENVLRQLATCNRKQGKLDKALGIYADLSKQYLDKPEYSYTVAALTAELDGCVPEVLNQPRACPILEWKNFLPQQTMEELVYHLYLHQKNFQPAKVGVGKDHKEARYEPEARNNSDLSLKGHPIKKQVTSLIVERLPEITRRLGLTPFSASRTEVKLRAYHDGEYFRIHQDGGEGRQISYTYFFHPEPVRFSGGELVTFDTDTEKSTFSDSFTRILPKHNSAFFFPSNFYHAVLPVETQDKNFMSARFVINGHVWEKTRK